MIFWLPFLDLEDRRNMFDDDMEFIEYFDLEEFEREVYEDREIVLDT